MEFKSRGKKESSNSSFGHRWRKDNKLESLVVFYCTKIKIKVLDKEVSL